MSQENVELVRALCDLYARGEYEEALSLLDESVELTAPPDVTGGGSVSHGSEDTRRAIAGFVGTWADYYFEIEDLIDGGDRVLVQARQGGRGRGSGAAVSELIYTVFTVSSRRVVGMQMYRNREDALEAVGLTE